MENPRQQFIIRHAGTGAAVQFFPEAKWRHMFALGPDDEATLFEDAHSASRTLSDYNLSLGEYVIEQGPFAAEKTPLGPAAMEL